MRANVILSLIVFINALLCAQDLDTDRRFEHLGKYSEIFKDVKKDETLEEFTKKLDVYTDELFNQAVQDLANIQFFGDFSQFKESEIEVLKNNDHKNVKIEDKKNEIYKELMDKVTHELLEIPNDEKINDIYNIDKYIKTKINKKYPLCKINDEIDLSIGGYHFNGKITNINERNIYINRRKYPKDEIPDEMWACFNEKEHDKMIMVKLKEEKHKFQTERERIVNERFLETLTKFVTGNFVRNITLGTNFKFYDKGDFNDVIWISKSGFKQLLKEYIINCFRGYYLNKKLQLEEEKKRRIEEEKEEFNKKVVERLLQEEEHRMQAAERRKQWEERQKQAAERKRQEEERRQRIEEKERENKEYAQYLAENPDLRQEKAKELIDGWLSAMRIKNSTSGYWVDYRLSQELFNVSEWTILAYSFWGTFGNAVVNVKSTNKSGMAIAINWTVNFQLVNKKYKIWSISDK